MSLLKMYSLLKIRIFHCYVSLPEGMYMILLSHSVEYVALMSWDLCQDICFFLGQFWNMRQWSKPCSWTLFLGGILFPHWYSDYVISHDNINKFPGTWINLYFESSVSFLGFWSRFRTSRTQMSLTEPGLWPKVCLKLKKTKWTPQQLLGCRGETLGKFGRCTERTQMGRAPCCFWLEFRPSKIEVIWFSLSLSIYITYRFPWGPVITANYPVFGYGPGCVLGTYLNRDQQPYSPEV